MRTFWTVFSTLFLAEVGDKTQLAVVAFASEATDRWTVFLAASAALVASTAVAVLLGASLARLVPTGWIQLVAGVVFVVVGVLVIREALPTIVR